MEIRSLVSSLRSEWMDLKPDEKLKVSFVLTLRLLIATGLAGAGYNFSPDLKRSTYHDCGFRCERRTIELAIGENETRIFGCELKEENRKIIEITCSR